MLMGLADAAASDGLAIRPVFPPRPIGILLGLEGSQNPFSGTPSYKSIAAKSLAERVAAMRDPAFRARLLAEDRFAGSNFPLLPRLSFARMFGFTDPPNYAPPESASIAAIAAREGRTAEDVAYGMLLEDEGRAFIFAPLVNYADYTLDASRAMMGHKNAIVGLSDGGAHVGFISDGSYPTFLLSYWGRDVGKDAFPIEELVRRQTSDTARAVGLHDRGVLAVGKKADVNIIDFAKLDMEFPTMLIDLPAGGRRLIQKARGYKATIKAGQITYRDGAPTGALPGVLVRGPQG